MKRQSPSPVLRGLRPMLACLIVLVAAIALVPLGAQNAAKRAMELEDILAFRALGTTVAVDERPVVRLPAVAAPGRQRGHHPQHVADKEMKFPVGEGAGGAVDVLGRLGVGGDHGFADADGRAGQHARAPAESDERDAS